MEKSLLQKGQKFAISQSSTLVIDYITATKHTCDSIRENILFRKTDCLEFYAKVKDVLTKFTAKPKPIVSNITKEEGEAIQNIRKDDSYIVLTADRGVALVVIDKDIHNKNLWPYWMEVYSKYKDQTDSIHAKVLTNNF